MTQEETTAPVVYEGSAVAVPDTDSVADVENRFAVAVKQRELLENYIKARMKPGKHFYKVARDGGGEGKPSLTKEGAELICLPHNYKPRYSILGGPEHPPEGTDSATPYQITVKCELMRNRAFSGEGLGSANSHTTNRQGHRTVRQTDPGLCHNATLKMAQKSAYIAATLNATAASEFFTQDMEHAATPPTAGAEGIKYWCAEHKVVWFKKGGMRGYAHPLDGGGWCNMPAAGPGTAEPAPDSEAADFDDLPSGSAAEEPEAPRAAGGPTTASPSNTGPAGAIPEFADIGEFFTWCKNTQGLTLRGEIYTAAAVENQPALEALGLKVAALKIMAAKGIV